MASRLLQTPHEPGDVVRDPKTKKDYVVESVVAAAAGVGVVIVAVNLWTEKSEEFLDASVQESNLDPFVKNVEHASPRAVRRKIQDRIARACANRQDLLELLKKPEGQVFRDLLLLSTEIDERKFTTAIGELAEALVDTTRGVPTDEQIFKVFRSHLPKDKIPDEVIREFARTLSAESKHKAVLKFARGTNRLGQIADSAAEKGLSELLFDVPKPPWAASPQNSQLSVMRRAGLAGGRREFSSAAQSSFGKAFTDEVLAVGTRTGKTHRFGDGPLMRAVQSLSTPEERIRYLFETALKDQGAGLSDLSRQRIDQMVAQATNAAKAGARDPLLDFIVESKSEGMEKAREFHRLAAGSDKPWLSRSRNKLGATRIPDYEGVRPGLNMAQVAGAEDLPSGSRLRDVDSVGDRRVLSMDQPTFFRDALADRSFKLDGKTVTLETPGVAKRIRELLGDETSPVLLEPRDLRTLLGVETPFEEVAGTLRRQPLDLNAALEGSHRIHGSLSADTQEALLRSHGQVLPQGYVRNAASERVMQLHVPPGAGEPGTTLASRFAQTDAFESTVAGLEHAFDIAPPQPGMRRVYIAPSPAYDGDLVGAFDPERLLDEIEPGQGPLIGEAGSRNASLMYADLPVSDLANYIPEGEEVFMAEPMRNRMKSFVPAALREQADLANVAGWVKPFNLSRVDDIARAVLHDRVGGAPAQAVGNVSAIAAPIDEVAREYYRAKGQFRVALASVGGKTRFVGSEMPVPVGDQVSRIDEFLRGDGRGALLDIETRNVAGAREIHDVSVRRFVGDRLESVHDWDASLGEAGNIRRVADAIDSLSVVGSHTNYDFTQLSTRARMLGMDDVADRLQAQMKGKGFDTTSFFQKAGVEGPLNQQDLMLQAMHENPALRFASQFGDELHEAAADNEDMLKLLLHHRDRYLQNEFRVLSPEEILSSETVFYNRDARSGLRYGALDRLVSVGEIPGGGVEAVFQHLGLGEKGDLIYGGMHSVRADSAQQLAARLNVSSEAVDVSDRAALDRVSRHYRTVSDEQSERFLRQLNPFARTNWDPLGHTEFAHQGQRDGPFGAMQLRVENSAREVLQQAKDIVHAQTFPNGLVGEAQRQRAIADAAQSMATQQTSDPGMQERIRHRIVQALNDPREETILLRSSRARFLEGPLGGMLAEFAADESFGRGNLYAMGYSNLMDAANRTEGVVVERMSRPRLSIELAGMVTRAEFGTSTGTATARSMVEDAAGKVLLALTGHGEGKADEAFEILKRALGGESEAQKIQALAQDWVKTRVLDGAGRHGDYLEAVRELSFVGAGDEYHALAVARAKIAAGGDMGQAISDSLQAKAERFSGEQGAEHLARAGRVLADMERQATANPQGSYGARLQTALAREFHADGSAMRSMLEDPIRTIDFEGLADRLGGDGVEELRRRTLRMADELHHLGGEGAFDDLYNAILDRRSEMFKAGRPVDEIETMTADTIRQGLGRSSVSEAVGSKGAVADAHTAATQMATEATKGSGIREMGEAVNRAKRAASATGNVRYAHELNMGKAWQIAQKSLNRYTAPLLAVGGVLGLLAASTPMGGRQGGESTQPMDQQVRHASEQQADSDAQTLWTGQEDPFRLDVTFKGFVGSKDEHEALVRRVHDTISNEVQVRKVNSAIQDRRNRTHAVPAIQAMRGI